MSNEDYKYVWEERRKTYRVVTDKPTYSPETKKTTHHYVTVGKAKEKGGPIEFGPKHRAVEAARKGRGTPHPKTVTPSGERIVLEHAASATGLSKTLEEAFGKETAGQVLALACYFICTGDALSSASAWLEERGLPVLTAPRVSELLASLTEEKCAKFLRPWIKAKAEGKTLCYDITSISTYAGDIDLAEFGYNRDHEKWLKQVNLAMLTDKASHIPLAFRVVAGSLSDVKTLRDTVRDLRMYGAAPFGFVMDRGFWSSERLDMLTENRIRYMVPVPSSVAWARKLIAAHVADVFLAPPHEDADGGKTYGFTVHDPTGAGRHVWAHIFYSPSMETERKTRFVERYTTLRKELESGDVPEEHRAACDEYFTVSTVGRGGKRHVKEKRPLPELLAEANFGYWVLYTDMEKDAMDALADYRDRGYIESGFDDLKGATDARRLRVHSGKAVYGRLFLQFVAQILRAELRQELASFPAEAKKYAYSVGSLLSRVRSYSLVAYSGRYKPQYCTLTKGQKLIFKALGIAVADDEPDEEIATEALVSK